jgi:hypothetical protein
MISIFILCSVGVANYGNDRCSRDYDQAKGACGNNNYEYVDRANKYTRIYLVTIFIATRRKGTTSTTTLVNHRADSMTSKHNITSEIMHLIMPAAAVRISDH